MEAAGSSSRLSTRSWVLKWLGVLWAAGTVISLAKRGFAIELTGLPQAIYQQYAWLRDMLFVPVEWVFKEIPDGVKDALMLYALMSATAGRMCLRYYREFHGREATTYEVVFFTLFWPLLLMVNTIMGVMLVEAVIVGSVACAFFFWNYVQNLVGPS